MKRLCPACNRNRDEKFFVGPKGRICATCRKATSRRSARSTHLWRTYGITLVEYEALLDSQNGVCAICRSPRPYNLAVDHDHALESALIAAGVTPIEAARRSIRGLICKRENGLLRDVRDDAGILFAAAYYIDFPQAQRVLSSQLEAPAAE